MNMKKESLSESLKKLEAITEWFERQETVDVETALEKVKEGVVLIRESKTRLREVENEFEIVKKALEKGICRVLTDIERYASMFFKVLYRCKSVDESIPFRMGAKYCFVEGFHERILCARSKR
jgi:exonuclease VII small subunit